MDPPDTVLVDADTTFAFMLEAQSRGHRIDHCLPQDLYLDGGRVFARVRSALVQRNPSPPVVLGAAEDVCLHDVDSVWIRKDPPFDSNYLWLTQLLDRVVADTLVINRPRGVRDANEKLYACHFPELMPETLVTSDKARIIAFVKRVGGRAVIKPLDGAGGEGVMVLRVDEADRDFNVNAIIEATTKHGARMAMVQRFLPEVKRGDKRILLLNGEPLGGILRVPKADEARSNIHVGGSVEKTTLDAHDHAIINALKPRLIADGLWFVGLDVIGGKLTEVNVTSPTGIQQMSRLDNVNLSARVIDWAEQHASPQHLSTREEGTNG